MHVNAVLKYNCNLRVAKTYHRKIFVQCGIYMKTNSRYFCCLGGHYRYQSKLCRPQDNVPYVECTQNAIMEVIQKHVR